MVNGMNTFTSPHRASHARDLPPSPHVFSAVVLLLDCWRCCGLGLCGPRQQTLSHPGRGPRRTCSCCWHEGKDEKQKGPGVAWSLDREAVYEIKRKNVSSNVNIARVCFWYTDIMFCVYSLSFVIDKMAAGKELNKNKKRREILCGTTACIRKVLWVRTREEK